MSVIVEKLPSKIVQIEEVNVETTFVAWMLCEDGSVWIYDDTKRTYRNVHPPHEPPTQSSDLAEALKVLRRLWTYTEPTSEVSEEAYEDVHDFLEKHGA